MSKNRRGFRLPQRLHLGTLKNFVSEKSGKRCEKTGEILWKIGEAFDKNWGGSFFFLYPCLKNKKFDVIKYKIWNQQFNDLIQIEWLVWTALYGWLFNTFNSLNVPQIIRGVDRVSDWVFPEKKMFHSLFIKYQWKVKVSRK